MKNRALGAALSAAMGLVAWGHSARGHGEAPFAAPAGTEAAPANTTLALAAVDRRIADAAAAESAARAELADLAGKIAEARSRSTSSGRAFYKLTRFGVLPVGGGFDALVRHAMYVERARRAVVAELAAERRMRERGAELASTLDRLARDRAALSLQRQELGAAADTRADAERRDEAFARAFHGANGGDFVAIDSDAPSGAEGARVHADDMGGFASARGRLLFPVVGRAEIRPARREAGEGPGLEIRAAAGSVVRSVYPGRVAFSDRYGSYGRIIILDHGDHYFTVSGNLATADARVGDELSAGERIGTVGDEGRGPLLYFEARHGSRTIPPEPWLGVSRTAPPN